MNPNKEPQSYCFSNMRGTLHINSKLIHILRLNSIFIFKGHRNSIEHVISKHNWKQNVCTVINQAGCWDKYWHAETQLWLCKALGVCVCVCNGLWCWTRLPQVKIYFSSKVHDPAGSWTVIQSRYRTKGEDFKKRWGLWCTKSCKTRCSYILQSNKEDIVWR